MVYINISNDYKDKKMSTKLNKTSKNFYLKNAYTIFTIIQLLLYLRKFYYLL